MKRTTTTTTKSPNFVTVDGLSLRRAMALVCNAIDRKTHIPILGCVLISFDGTRLEFRGTDLEVEIETSIDTIDGGYLSWSACIDGAILSDIAKVAGCMSLRIEAKDGEASISLGENDAFYTVSTIDSGDFPNLGDSRGGLIETFPDGKFASMLAAATPYVSREETRYYLNGVCWQHGPSGRRMAATDGHRLYCCRYADHDGENASRIIPRKAVDILSRIARRASVSVYAVENYAEQIWVDIGDAIVRLKLISGRFPDFDRVIPPSQMQKHVIRFLSADVASAIERACAIGSEQKNNGQAVRFQPEAGKVAIERRRANNDRSKALTAADWPEIGEKLEPFAFNGRYFSEMIGGCKGEIELRIIDSSSPFQIADVDETVTRVLMPMRA